MEKPKLHEDYWYIEVEQDDNWDIKQKKNEMADMDKYNFACANFFATEDIAAENAFEMLLELTLYDTEQVGEMIARKLREK